MNGRHDTALEPRVREITVAEEASDLSRGADSRRTGGIETVLSGVDTDFDLGMTTAERIELTAGRLLSGGLFTGVLGLTLARYDSPVRFTFRDRQPDIAAADPDNSVDATDPDTLLDCSAAGSPQTALPAVDHRSSGLPVGYRNPHPEPTADGPIAPKTGPGSSTDRRFSRTAARLHQSTGPKQRTAHATFGLSPLTPTGWDESTPASLSAGSTQTQSALPRSGSQSTGQQTATVTDRLRPLVTHAVTAHSVSSLSDSPDPRIDALVAASGRQSVATHTDSATARHSPVSQRSGQPRRPVTELQPHSAETDRLRRPAVPSLVSTGSVSTQTAGDMARNGPPASFESTRRTSLGTLQRPPAATPGWQPQLSTPAPSATASSGRAGDDSVTSTDSYSSTSPRRLPSPHAATLTDHSTTPDTSPHQSVDGTNLFPRTVHTHRLRPSASTPLSSRPVSATATGGERPLSPSVPIAEASSHGRSMRETRHSRLAPTHSLGPSTGSHHHSPTEFDAASAGTGRTHQRRDHNRDLVPPVTRLRRQQSRQLTKPSVDHLTPTTLGQPRMVDRLQAVDPSRTATMRHAVWPRSADPTATLSEVTHHDRATHRQGMAAVDQTDGDTISSMGGGSTHPIPSAWSSRSLPARMGVSVDRQTARSQRQDILNLMRQETAPTATARRDDHSRSVAAPQHSDGLPSLSGPPRPTPATGRQHRSQRQQSIIPLRSTGVSDEWAESTLSTLRRSQFDSATAGSGPTQLSGIRNVRLLGFSTPASGSRHRQSIVSPQRRPRLTSSPTAGHRSPSTASNGTTPRQSATGPSSSRHEPRQQRPSSTAKPSQRLSLLCSDTRTESSVGDTTASPLIQSQSYVPADRRHSSVFNGHSRTSPIAEHSTDFPAVSDPYLPHGRPTIARRVPQFHVSTSLQSVSDSSSTLCSASAVLPSTVHLLSARPRRAAPMQWTTRDRQSTVSWIDSVHADTDAISGPPRLTAGTHRPHASESAGRRTPTDRNPRQRRQQLLAGNHDTTETGLHQSTAGSDPPPTASGTMQSMAVSGGRQQPVSETALARTHPARQSTGVDRGCPRAVTADSETTVRNDDRSIPPNGGRSPSRLSVSSRQPLTERTRLSRLSPIATGPPVAIGSTDGPTPVTRRRPTVVPPLSAASVTDRNPDRSRPPELSQPVSESDRPREHRNAASSFRTTTARQRSAGAVERIGRNQSATTTGRRSFVSDPTPSPSASVSHSSHTNTTTRSIPSADSRYDHTDDPLRPVDDTDTWSHPPTPLAVSSTSLSKTDSSFSHPRYTTDETIQRRPRQSAPRQQTITSGPVESSSGVAGSVEFATRSRSDHRLATVEPTPVAVDPALAPTWTRSTPSISREWSSTVDMSPADATQFEYLRRSDTLERVETTSPADSSRADASQISTVDQLSHPHRQSTDNRRLGRLRSPAAVPLRRTGRIESRDRVAKRSRLRGTHRSGTLSTPSRSDSATPQPHRLGPTPTPATGAATVETRRGEGHPESTAGSRHLRLSAVESAAAVFTSGSVHEQFVDRKRLSTGYDATVLSGAETVSPQTVAEQGDGHKRAVGMTSTPIATDWLTATTRSSPQPSDAPTISFGKTESARSADAMGSDISPAHSPDGNSLTEPSTADSRPRMTFKQPPTESARGSDAETGHDSTGGRVDPTPQQRHRASADGRRNHSSSGGRRRRGSATGGSGSERTAPQSASTQRDRTTAQSDLFESVDRPDQQPDSTIGQTPNRRQHRRDADQRADRSGLDSSLGAASLAYDADVDRVVETLYRRLERKLRIERERTGF